MLTFSYTLKKVEALSKGKGKGIFIGNKLRHLLKRMKISDRQLAKQLGVSNTAIYKWKYDKAGITWEYLTKLAEVLNVSPEYFLEYKGDGTMKATRRGFLIGDKLRRIMEEKGITQYKLSKMTGIPQPSISAYLKNKYGVSRPTLEKLAQALGVPPSYFIEEEPSKKYPPTPDVVEREYVAIPVIDKAGAGGEYYMDHYTLVQRSQLPYMRVIAYEVDGDSMEPTISSGEVVLIDPDDKELHEGGVYLFASGDGGVGNGFIIRRVKRVDDEWILVPDNPRYSPSKITFYAVVGKVKYKFRPNLEGVR